MQQSLKLWLKDYIVEHQKTQSRYEIDKFLIEAGFDGAEIEETWQTLAQLTANKKEAKEQIFVKCLYLFGAGVMILDAILNLQSKVSSNIGLVLALFLLALSSVVVVIKSKFHPKILKNYFRINAVLVCMCLVWALFFIK